MAVFDLYSKREKKKRNENKSDVFEYDDLPKPLRVQVVHILTDAFGRWRTSEWGSPPNPLPNELWQQLFQIVTREKGMFSLSEKGRNAAAQCQNYLLDAPTEDALDLIDTAFVIVHTGIRALHEHERNRWNLTEPDEAVAELNHRFREHSIGYSFEGGQLIRIDSTYVHAKSVKPAIQLLQGAGKRFAGPLDEFLEAHERYRKGETKDAISWSLKAFESMLKTICTVRQWTFDPQKDTASKLIEIVFANGLVPNHLQAQFSALRSILESGIPTVRNKTSGHGQGATPTTVPEHLARYVLHLTAVNIVFLFDCYKAIK